MGEREYRGLYVRYIWGVKREYLGRERQKRSGENIMINNRKTASLEIRLRQRLILDEQTLICVDIKPSCEVLNEYHITTNLYLRVGAMVVRHSISAVWSETWSAEEWRQHEEDCVSYLRTLQ